MRFKAVVSGVAQGVADFLAVLWHWAQTDAGATIVAGACGGLVRWVTLRESPREGLTAVVVGAVCAVYLGPLAVPMLTPILGAVNLGPDEVAGLSPFLVGLGGIGTTGFLLDAMRRRRALSGPVDPAEGVEHGGQ